MDFTREQEQELVEKNMPKIYRAVDNFMARCTAQVVRIPYDDYVQEVSLAFLQYIRKCETMEQVNKFPWYSAMDAMRSLVLQYQPIRQPKSSVRFREIIHSIPVTVNVDTLRIPVGAGPDGKEKDWQEITETSIDFDICMGSLPLNIRRIMAMRYHGMTLKQIGDQCGVTKIAIFNRLNKLGDMYKTFLEDEEDE